MITPIIDKYESLPFQWGTTDCCRFVCECVEDITGKDFAAKFDWHDLESAKDLVGRFGSLSALVTSELGPPITTPKNADVCMTVYRGQEILGVIDGDSCVFRTAAGVIRLPITRALAIWAT